MAQQLIFTSAVAGLNPGSSGYCTVARSEGMRDAVVAWLEQWSIYTHGVGEKNPVVCAYRVLNLRGSVYYVLTRIIDSGLDYTGRTNFLAHHLVFQPHEIHGACSPAEVFFQWPNWKEQWQGAPRYLNDDGLVLHGIPRVTQMPAATWAEWTGDAGGAALLLAENSSGASARSVDLVVPAGFESGLLRLYAESLYLTDPKGENAPVVWAVPFTTFLQTQDDPTDFRWRGLSLETRGRVAAEILVDFAAGAIPPVSSSSLSDYARTGTPKAAYLPGVNMGTFMSGMSAKASAVSVPTVASKVRSRSPLTYREGPRREEQVNTEEGVPRWVWIAMACAVFLGLGSVWLYEKLFRNDDPPKTHAVYAVIPLFTPAPTPFSTLNESLPSSEAKAPSILEPLATEQQTRLVEIISKLENAKVLDPKSPLSTEKNNKLNDLKDRQRKNDITSSVVNTYDEQVKQLCIDIGKNNAQVEDQNALSAIPSGFVYVIHGSTPSVTIADSNGPLIQWLNILKEKGETADRLYTARLKSSAKETDGEKVSVIGSTDKRSIGILEHSGSAYNIVRNENSGDSFASISLPAGINVTEILSFKPEQSDAPSAFSLLFLGSEPGLSVRRAELIEQSNDPTILRFKPTIVDLLHERFAQWKNTSGIALKPVLVIRFKEKEFASDTNFNLDFGSLNKALQDHFDATQAAFKQADQKAKAEKIKMESVRASQKELSDIPFDGEAGKMLGSQAKLSSTIDGKAFYYSFTNWVRTICNIPNDETDKLLPFNAKDRVEAIKNAIPQIASYANKKQVLKNKIDSFVTALNKIDWQSHEIFLNDRWNLVEQRELESDAEQARILWSHADAQLRSAPNKADISGYWIGEASGHDYIHYVELKD